MLGSHNILNPANGAPITVPSQDMVLGLYYTTKARKGTKETPVKGEGLTFYSSSEVIIAYNEKKIDLHSIINVRMPINKINLKNMKLLKLLLEEFYLISMYPIKFHIIIKFVTKKT